MFFYFKIELHPQAQKQQAVNTWRIEGYFILENKIVQGHHNLVSADARFMVVSAINAFRSAGIFFRNKVG
ncbi:MAG: hypothetical protein V1753_10260 [Pseudomonadota bacterium]